MQALRSLEGAFLEPQSQPSSSASVSPGEKTMSGVCYLFDWEERLLCFHLFFNAQNLFLETPLRMIVLGSSALMRLFFL